MPTNLKSEISTKHLQGYSELTLLAPIKQGFVESLDSRTYATRLKTGVANLSGSRGEFDWSGAFGTTFWVDPKEKLSVVFMSQQGGLQRVLMRQLIRMLVMAAVAD